MRFGSVLAGEDKDDEAREADDEEDGNDVDDEDDDEDEDEDEDEEDEEKEEENASAEAADTDGHAHTRRSGRVDTAAARKSGASPGPTATWEKGGWRSAREKDAGLDARGRTRKMSTPISSHGSDSSSGGKSWSATPASSAASTSTSASRRRTGSLASSSSLPSLWPLPMCAWSKRNSTEASTTSASVAGVNDVDGAIGEVTVVGARVYADALDESELRACTPIQVRAPQLVARRSVTNTRP